MAGDWIKMRSALLQSPKLIAISRELNANAEFRGWLTPGGGGPFNGQLVSDDALRCVTGALLLRVWSAAREHGKYIGADLFLPFITVQDLDVMGGVAGLGQAMVDVEWARESGRPKGIFLPNFKEFNIPSSAAERQQTFRERHGNPKAGWRNAALRGSNAPSNAKEKRREDLKEPPIPPTNGTTKPKSEGAITFDRFMTICHDKSEKPIPATDPIWDFAEKAGIPENLVVLHWKAFRDRYTKTAKRYTRWSDVFGRSVKGNWFHLWRVDAASGEIVISQQGEILRKGFKGGGSGAA